MKCDQKTKELSLCHKLKFSNPHIFANDGENLSYFKFRLVDISDKIQIFRYLRSTTLSDKDIRIIKSEFVKKFISENQSL